MYPGYVRTVGLHPKNESAVHLYRIASEDQRSEGVLIGTLNIVAACKAMDEHADLISGPKERRETLELMWLLGKLVTKHRVPIEAAARKRAMEAAERDAKQKSAAGRRM